MHTCHAIQVKYLPFLIFILHTPHFKFQYITSGNYSLFHLSHFQNRQNNFAFQVDTFLCLVIKRSVIATIIQINYHIQYPPPSLFLHCTLSQTFIQLPFLVCQVSIYTMSILQNVKLLSENRPSHEWQMVNL